MVVSSTIQSALQRHQATIDTALRTTVQKFIETTALSTSHTLLQHYYAQMQYHLGWVDAEFQPTMANPGKLLRPTLLLLAYEMAGAWGLTDTTTAQISTDYLQRALPAAVSVELTHNFTLIHDDIEDHDTERRHRPTLWSIWGIPQAINTGDGMFALARLVLWDLLDRGVDGTLAARLAAVLDRHIAAIAEGQYLDMGFETQNDVTTALYIDMISRKTAALMACSAQMGAMLGTTDQETISRFHDFGNAIGVAFQIRDDILGVWASVEKLGKTSAGDIYRRKKSLPILHALEHADPQDAQTLKQIYEQSNEPTTEQVESVIEIMARTNTRTYCTTFLQEQCQVARDSLANVPVSHNAIATRARSDIETMIQFVTTL
jgi:geranylgeranyl diphosphate synthase, type I